jgi:hypothetical protein
MYTAQIEKNDDQEVSKVTIVKTKLSKSEYKSVVDKIDKLDDSGASENQIKRDERARKYFDHIE